jgi:LysR family glycine cleavage system transcriptional activator
LRAFESAARLGTLRAAADELGVTPGAVSQQVKGLETHLGVRLFDRGAHSLTLTAEGQRYAPVLRDAFDAMAAATLGLGRSSAQAVVELTMPALFANGWMLPRLERFRAAHRDVDLRLRNSNRLLTPGTENVVAAIRHGRAGWENLVCVYLFGDALVAVCHPQVAAGLARGAGGRLSLEGATLLIPEDGDAPWAAWQELAGLGGHPRRLVLGDEGLVVQAALNNLGLALVDQHVVEGPLRQGRLVVPFEVAPWRRGTAWYLVYATHQDRDPPLGAVRDWLLEETAAPTP